MSSGSNIVLVTADSLRADHCGFLGSDHETTPTLDRMAEDGLVFENAVAPGPRTPSSMPVTFTGEYVIPEDLSVVDWHERRQQISQHLSRHGTFVERLQNSGYTTVGVTVNPWTSQDTGFDTGFDSFSELSELDPTWPWYVRTFDKIIDLAGYGTALQWGVQKDWFAQWQTYYENLRSKIAELTEPFFLWVFVLDPHLPYIAPAEVRQENSWVSMWYGIFRYWQQQYRDGSNERLSGHAEKRIRRAYRDTVRSVDELVRSLERDTPDGTAFVFHADHGEAFKEHGRYGHQRQLFDENIHVPLLGYNVGKTGRVTKPATLSKLPQFIESIASLSESQKNGTSGLDLPTTTAAVAQTETGEKTAVRTCQWKYIEHKEDAHLFDLSSDPAEKYDCASKHPKIVGGLATIAERHRESLDERRRIADSVSAVGDRR